LAKGIEPSNVAIPIGKTDLAPIFCEWATAGVAWARSPEGKQAIVRAFEDVGLDVAWKVQERTPYYTAACELHAQGKLWTVQHAMEAHAAVFNFAPPGPDVVQLAAGMGAPDAAAIIAEGGDDVDLPGEEPVAEATDPTDEHLQCVTDVLHALSDDVDDAELEGDNLECPVLDSSVVCAVQAGIRQSHRARVAPRWQQSDLYVTA